MQQVPQEHKLRRPVMQQQSAEARQVFARGARGHGLAQGAVGGGFAEVKVGHKQHAAGGPPQRALG